MSTTTTHLKILQRRGKLIDFDTGTRTISSKLAPKDEDVNRQFINVSAVDGGDTLQRIRSAEALEASQWHDMKTPTMTPEIERDLRMIRLRRWADPKHHFTRDDYVGKKGELPKVFQLGTVVSGVGERSLTRKNRKQSITAEFLADDATRKYAKRVFDEIQTKRTSGGKNAYKRRHKKMMRDKLKR